MPTAGPGTKIPKADAAPAAAGVPAACNTASVTPACLRALYGTDTYKPAPVKGKSDVFVAGFIGQSEHKSAGLNSLELD